MAFEFDYLWLDIFDWISPIEGDEYNAWCTLCSCVLSIHSNGIHSLRQHEKGSRHKRNERAKIFERAKDIPSTSSQPDGIHLEAIPPPILKRDVPPLEGLNVDNGSRITKPGNASELQTQSEDYQSATYQPQVLLEKVNMSDYSVEADVIPGLSSTRNNEISHPSISYLKITNTPEGEVLPANTNTIEDSVLSKDLSIYDFFEPEDSDMNQQIAEEKCKNIAQNVDKYKSSPLPSQKIVLDADVAKMLNSRGVTIQFSPVTNNAHNSEDCRVSSKLSSSSDPNTHKSSKDSSVKTPLNTPIQPKLLEESTSCLKSHEQNVRERKESKKSSESSTTHLNNHKSSKASFFQALKLDCLVSSKLSSSADPNTYKSSKDSSVKTAVCRKPLKKSASSAKFDKRKKHSTGIHKSPVSKKISSEKAIAVKHTEQAKEKIISCSISDNKTEDFQKSSEPSCPSITDANVQNSNKDSLVETVVHTDLWNTKTVIENAPSDEDLPQLHELPNIQMGDHIQTLKPRADSDETSAAMDVSDKFYKDEQEKLYGEHLSSIQEGTCYFSSTYSDAMSGMLESVPLLERSGGGNEARSDDLITQEVASNVKKQNGNSDSCLKEKRNSLTDSLSKESHTSTQTNNLPILFKRECANVRDLKLVATYMQNMLKEERRIYNMKRRNIFTEFHKFFIETISKKSFSFGDLDFVREMVNYNQSEASVADTRFSAAFLAFCNTDTDGNSDNGDFSTNPYDVVTEKVFNLKREKLEKFSSRSANCKVSPATCYASAVTNMYDLEKLGAFEQGASTSLDNEHQDETKFKKEIRNKEKNLLSEVPEAELGRQCTPLTQQQIEIPPTILGNSELTIRLLASGSDDSVINNEKTSGGSRHLKRKASTSKDQPPEKVKFIKKSSKTKEALQLEKFRFNSKKNAINRVSR